MPMMVSLRRRSAIRAMGTASSEFSKAKARPLRMPNWKSLRCSAALIGWPSDPITCRSTKPNIEISRNRTSTQAR